MALTPEKLAMREGVTFLRKAPTAQRDGIGEEAAEKIVEQVETALVALIMKTEGLDYCDARNWLEVLVYPHVSPSPNHS